MADSVALQRLLLWSSPAFPVGMFAYSGGLETAIVEGKVNGVATMRGWLEGNLRHGSGRNDTILATLACRAFANPARLAELSDLCLALTPAHQRYQELLVTGQAFIQAAQAWPRSDLGNLPAACPYPIAFGAIAGASGINAKDCALAFLTAYAQAQISVAVRLVPIGQTDGLAMIAALEMLIENLAGQFAFANEDDLGSIAYATDVAAMNHETLVTRIFRS